MMIMTLQEHTMSFGPISTISRVTLEQVMTGSLEMVAESAVSPVFVPSIYTFWSAVSPVFVPSIYTFLTESLQILRNSHIKYEIYYNHKLAHTLPHTTITEKRYSLYRLHKTSKFLIAHFWIMSSCSQVVDYHHYRATDYLHSQGRSENDGT
jgi:hypothetical protein